MTINFIKKIKSVATPRASGFTIIETLVALGILLIAVAGPISLIGDSVHKMYYARDEALAVNLAQEGIELVRQARDTNMLKGTGWLTDLADGTYTVDAHSFISTGGSRSGNGGSFITPCGASCAPQPVYLDAATGFYRQNVVSTPTQFSRIITVSSAGLPANERKVTSTVTWRTGGSLGTISTSEYIFSWAL